MTSTRLVLAFKIACIGAALLLPAIPQPLDYHDFADQRSLLGIPNFLDVVSNAGFVLAGLVGLAATLGGAVRFERNAERVPYAVFFAGVLLTGFGSAYYHLAPDNETLFWDRLPMTIAFMGLVSSQFVDRIGVRFGLALLGPMLALGVASVWWWRATERIGSGNVLPYAILQAYSVVVLLILAIVRPSRYTRGNDVYAVFAWYVAAKLLETWDTEVFALTGGVVSGHTLKHVAAAIAAAVVWRMLVRRRLAVPAAVTAPAGSAPGAA